MQNLYILVAILSKKHTVTKGIVIENTKQNEIVEKENRLFSTKPNKEQHGFGVDNIKMAVAKYDGLVSIEHTKDKFTLAIVLPIPD